MFEVEQYEKYVTEFNIGFTAKNIKVINKIAEDAQEKLKQELRPLIIEMASELYKSNIISHHDYSKLVKYLYVD